MGANCLEESPPWVFMKRGQHRVTLREKIGPVSVEEVNGKLVHEIRKFAANGVKVVEAPKAIQDLAHPHGCGARPVLDGALTITSRDETRGGALCMKQWQLAVLLHNGFTPRGDQVRERRDDRVVGRTPVLAEKVRQHQIRQRAADPDHGVGEDLAGSPFPSTVMVVEITLDRVRIHDMNRLAPIADGSRQPAGEIDVSLLHRVTCVRSIDTRQVIDGCGTFKALPKPAGIVKFAPSESQRLDTGDGSETASQMPSEETVPTGNDDITHDRPPVARAPDEISRPAGRHDGRTHPS